MYYVPQGNICTPSFFFFFFYFLSLIVSLFVFLYLASFQISLYIINDNTGFIFQFRITEWGKAGNGLFISLLIYYRSFKYVIPFM